MAEDELRRSAEQRALSALGALSLPGVDPVEVVRGWWPAEDEWEALFLGEAAARARVGYAALHAHPPRIVIDGPTLVDVYSATVPELVAWTDEAAEHFPGGYRRIAHLLAPGPLWLCFSFEDSLSYDGLVVLEGRVRWCPKPWRVLGGS